MIIGILGKVGSGKDTVANIVQYLTTNKKNISHSGSYNSYIMDIGMGGNITSKWKVKKFAGALKQIISLMTGYSLEELEQQEIKNKILGDEWQIYELYNFNEKLISAHPYSKLVKGFTTEEEVQDFCDEKTSSQHQFTYKKTQRTVRWLLQYIGTDLFRNRLHPNVHVNMLFNSYTTDIEKPIRGQISRKEIMILKKRLKYYYDSFPNWLITDVRFPNEAQAIKNRDGLLFRINRGTTNFDGVAKIVEHESETALDNYPHFDEIIDNNGSIDELITKVKEILIKHKII